MQSKRSKSRAGGASTYRFTFSTRHQKLMIGTLAVVVVIAFAFGGALSQCARSTRGQEDIAGMIGDEEVFPNELWGAKRFTRIELSLSYGAALPNTERVEQIVDELAWRRLAALREAEKLGIFTGDAEVLAAIQARFADETGDYQNGFNFFRLGTLRELDVYVSQHELEQYFREVLTISKLRDVVSTSVWVPRTVVYREILERTDLFAADYVLIPMSGLVDENTELTIEEAQEFFDEHSEYFTLPERVRAHYVMLSYSNYLPDVAVTESQITNYYATNLYVLYTHIDTNSMIQTVDPLDDVRDEIEHHLAMERASALAGDEAMAFLAGLSPTDNFSRAATEAGYVPMTSAWFAVTEPVEGLNTYLTFNAAAFRLGDEPGDELHASSPVRGTNEVFVISFGGRKPSHIPELAEVSNEVWTSALEMKEYELLQEKARTLRSSLAELVAEGKTFPDAAEELGLEAEHTGQFSYYLPSTNIVLSERFKIAAMARLPGEMTEPVPLGHTNALTVALITGRVRGSDPRIEGMLFDRRTAEREYERTGLLFRQWQQSLMASVAMEDRFKPRPPGQPVPAVNETNEPPADPAGSGGASSS